MEERGEEGAEDGAGEGDVLQERGGGVRGCEDRVEDCGEVEGVERGGGGGDDYRGGLGEAVGL